VAGVPGRAPPGGGGVGAGGRAAGAAKAARRRRRRGTGQGHCRSEREVGGAPRRGWCGTGRVAGSVAADGRGADRGGGDGVRRGAADAGEAAGALARVAEGGEDAGGTPAKGEIAVARSRPVIVQTGRGYMVPTVALAAASQNRFQ